MFKICYRNYPRRVGALHSLDFHKTNMEIFVSTCSATDTRKMSENTCYRCHSLEHYVKDCPFNEGAQVEKNAAAYERTQSYSAPARPRNDHSQRGRGNYQQRDRGHAQQTQQPVCIKFNAGDCTLPCPRKHVCNRCGGPEPRPRCLTCTPPPSFSNFSSQPGSLGSAPAVFTK